MLISASAVVWLCTTPGTKAYGWCPRADKKVAGPAESASTSAWLMMAMNGGKASRYECRSRSAELHQIQHAYQRLVEP